jgi:hypothetical protein
LFRCDGLHRPGFPTLLLDVLHRFGYTGLPAYCSRPYRQFRLGHYKVHVDILAHPVALLPVQNEGNVVWSERVATIGDPELLTHQVGWALTARYAQHVSSLLQEVTATGAHLRLCLEECVSQVKAKNRVINDIQKGNRGLLQQNACLKMRIRELNDELMRTYRSHDFKTDDLDDTRTQLQHAQDELTAVQSYIHHLETELHERRATRGESGSGCRLAARGGAPTGVDPPGA